MSDHWLLIPTNPPNAIEMWANPDQLIRQRLSQTVLESWSPKHALALVTSALTDTRTRVLAEATRIVGEMWIRCPQTRDQLCMLAPTLSALVSHRHHAGRIRKSAAWSLGWIGDHHALDALKTLHTHDNPMYRRVCVEATGRIGGAEALEVLVTSLYDHAWQVRMDAAIGLGGLPKEVAASAHRALLEALCDEQHMLAGEQMLRSLPEVAHWSGTTCDEARTFLKHLVENADTQPQWYRAAAQGLVELDASCRTKPNPSGGESRT